MEEKRNPCNAHVCSLNGRRESDFFIEKRLIALESATQKNNEVLEYVKTQLELLPISVQADAKLRDDISSLSKLLESRIRILEEDRAKIINGIGIAEFIFKKLWTFILVLAGFLYWVHEKFGDRILAMLSK